LVVDGDTVKKKRLEQKKIDCGVGRVKGRRGGEKKKVPQGKKKKETQLPKRTWV